MKRIKHIYALLVALWMLAGCTQGTDLLPELSEYPIRWGVNLEQEQDARSLMDASLLQSLCTETGGDTNESIGIWGQYTFGEQTRQVFEDTELTYVSTAWNYSGDIRYWMLGAVYDFRAYYPKELMTRLMTEKSPARFRGMVNTSEVQEDILVAAQHVDTETANLSHDVSLHMHHVFAAIKFKVKAIDGFTPDTNDGITSCWLQNATGDTNLFSTSGTLEHTGNTTQNISWTKDASTTAPMYLWEHEGLGFATETMFYASNGNGAGNVYTKNDGWLLVIPQEVKSGSLSFCFTRKKTGNQVFSVNIPTITYERGKRYNYLLEIDGANAELSLSIQPWNIKDFSHKISVKNTMFVRRNPGVAIENNTYVKHDSLYLIVNKQSGKYFYANPDTKQVEARAFDASHDVVDPNFVWKFKKTSPLGGSTWHYYFIESMGNPGYCMQASQVTGNLVPLAQNPIGDDAITLRQENAALRMRLRSSGTYRFLAVNGDFVYGYASYNSNSSHDVSLYEVTGQKAGLQIE